MLRLIFFQIGCLVSSLLMLAFRASETALWMGTSTFGLFMSNVFPTSVALAEQYFNVTGLSNRSAQFYRPLIFLLFQNESSLPWFNLLRSVLLWYAAIQPVSFNVLGFFCYFTNSSTSAVSFYTVVLEFGIVLHRVSP